VKLFHAFGCTVRLHWLTFLVPLSLYFAFEKWLSAGDAALWALAWSAAIYFVIWTHEMGHVAAGRHLGIPTRTITLWPLGGLAHLERRAPSPGGEMFISAAGPAVHLAWFTALGAPYFAFVHDRLDLAGAAWPSMLHGFVWLQCVFLVFNLLPFWPLDGGAILRGFLARRMHPNRASITAAWVGLAGAAIMAIGSVAVILGATNLTGFLGDQGWLLLSLAIGGALACRQLLLEAQVVESPYDTPEPDEAWRESIPQARWSGESDTDTAEAVLESARAEKKAERAEKKPARERRVAPRRAEESAAPPADPRRALQERIDVLLDRINEAGGIEKLTDAERKELAEKSKALRHTN
jgi:Zn-dependent protease